MTQPATRVLYEVHYGVVLGNYPPCCTHLIEPVTSLEKPDSCRPSVHCSQKAHFKCQCQSESVKQRILQAAFLLLKTREDLPIHVKLCLPMHCNVADLLPCNDAGSAFVRAFCKQQQLQSDLRGKTSVLHLCTAILDSAALRQEQPPAPGNQTAASHLCAASATPASVSVAAVASGQHKHQHQHQHSCCKSTAIASAQHKHQHQHQQYCAKSSLPAPGDQTAASHLCNAAVHGL